MVCMCVHGVENIDQMRYSCGQTQKTGIEAGQVQRAERIARAKEYNGRSAQVKQMTGGRIRQTAERDGNDVSAYHNGNFPYDLFRYRYEMAICIQS